MKGWIKIPRNIQQHWLWQNAEYLQWWIDLNLLACYEPTNTTSGTFYVKLNKGQLIASESFLSTRWGTTRKRVQRFLLLLLSDELITRETKYGKVTIITICNYDNYAEETVGRKNSIGYSTEVSTGYSTGYTNKEIEEINNIKNNSLYSLAGENEFFENCLKQEFLLKVSEVYSIRVEAARAALEQFNEWNTLRDAVHKDLRDYKDHFVKWLPTYIKSNNKNTYQYENTTCKLQDRRRGYNAVAHEAKDYEGPFVVPNN